LQYIFYVYFKKMLARISKILIFPLLHFPLR
jgi:hypothetical protein